MSTPVTKQTSEHKTPAERMRVYRERMRVKGYVQKTSWVPDTGNPKVLARYHRAGAAIAASDPASDDIQPSMDAALEELFRDEPAYDWGDDLPSGVRDK